MADSLASAMENLRLTAKDLDPTSIQTQLETPIAEGENGASSGPGPRKQAHQSGTELLAELEAEFLTPSSKFTPSWLNQLQQYVSHSSFVCAFPRCGKVEPG